jgi:hypothetical protein
MTSTPRSRAWSTKRSPIRTSQLAQDLRQIGVLPPNDKSGPMNRPQISAGLAGLVLAALSGAIVSAMVFAVAIYLAR